MLLVQPDDGSLELKYAFSLLNFKVTETCSSFVHCLSVNQYISYGANVYFIEILHVSITQWNVTSESMTHLCHFSNFRHVDIMDIIF